MSVKVIDKQTRNALTYSQDTFEIVELSYLPIKYLFIWISKLQVELFV